MSGISGDMTLGTLVDVGVPLDLLNAGVRSLGLENVHLEATTVKKCGFRAAHVQVVHQPEHAHRHLHHIEAMIDQADQVAAEAKEIAKRIFQRLGEAEAKVHGTTLQKVHFHEVGAVDSIADIVGTAIGLHWLGIEAFEASPVPTGTGFIEIAHGRVSVPAPATAELLQDVPLSASEIESELTTPTGAAILKTLVRRFGGVPSMRIEAIGYGAGSRDLAGQANVLRLFVGTVEDAELGFPVEVDQVVVLEANIDNTTGEDLATCVTEVWAAGAVDVYQAPCAMKKGRQGTQVTVLSAPSRVPAIEAALFTHSGTIGVRRYHAARHKLIRQSHQVETELGSLRGKCVWLPSGRWRFNIEHEDAAAAAAAHGRTLEEVRQLAMMAFAAQQPPLPPA